MSIIRTALKEIAGLFVDDGSLAAAILVWLIVVSIAAHAMTTFAPWSGAALLAGLALLFLENVLRRARESKRK